MQKTLIIDRLTTDFCHASTVVNLPDGGLMCCWFGGRREGSSDVAIYGSRWDGRRWSSPRRLADGAEANWNPVLFYRGDGRLQLFYKEGQAIADWRTLYMISADNGLTWSGPAELVPGDKSGGRGPVRNKPIRLASGRVIAGASVERGLWMAFADYSDDGCETWTKSNAIAVEGLDYTAGEKTAESSIEVSQQSFYGRGVIQPSLWESEPGRVHMLLRSSEGRVYRSDSSDGGRSWCSACATELPNNNSGLDLAQAGGCLYLACNPVGEAWGRRSPLTLFKSADNGQSWRKLLDLETGEGEYSYPAVIGRGGGLCITYTHNRRNIACVLLDKDEI